MHRGYITLHRKLLDWEWYDDANTFRVFVHLLLMANWQDKKWRGKLIKRGQAVIGVEKFGEEIKLSRKAVRTALKKLEKSEIVAIKGASKYTLVTVINYDSYQTQDEKGASNGAIKGPSKGHQRAIKGPQLNHVSITNHESITNKKNSISSDKSAESPTPKSTTYTQSFEQFWQAYPSKTGKAAAAKAFTRAIKKISLPDLIAAVEVYKASRRVKEGYICNPATWLNQERWHDVPEDPRDYDPIEQELLRRYGK